MEFDVVRYALRGVWGSERGIWVIPAFGRCQVYWRAQTGWGRGERGGHAGYPVFGLTSSGMCCRRVWGWVKVTLSRSELYITLCSRHSSSGPPSIPDIRNTCTPFTHVIPSHQATPNSLRPPNDMYSRKESMTLRMSVTTTIGPTPKPTDIPRHSL